MSPLLRIATNAEKCARDEVTWLEWGKRLTVPQYVDREHALRNHRWALTAMTTWLLADADDILCSCETFRNDSSVGNQTGTSFSVASVFTEPHLRGKGYAKQLMSELISKLRSQPDAQSSVLYSDVGAAIYEKSGYRALPAWDWVLPPAELPLEAQWLETPLPVPVRARQATSQLLLHPSGDQLDWHFERSRLYARFLGRPELAHYGARTADATIWWTAQFHRDELLVLWLDAPDGAAAAPLLRAAQRQAHALGLPRVRVWETFSLAQVDGAQRCPRVGELPMVVPLNATFTDWGRVERALWV